MVGKAAVSGNWQNFLWADNNKPELFSFLPNAATLYLALLDMERRQHGQYGGHRRV